MTAASSATAAPSVEFFFDPISPYAWLASKELDRIEAAGYAVDCKPLLFAGLLNAHGNIGPAEIPAKRAYTFRDVMRLAAQRGWPLLGPPAHPYNPLRALRTCIALDDRGERRRYTQALLAATWERGLDLADAAVLAAIAADCGLGERGLQAAADSPGIKERLAAATRDAIAAGVFGVPTFRVGDELFWGHDRVDALLWHCAGGRIDDAALGALLQRGATARRRPPAP
ncbi:MAG: 2-hydroxychromene-2-carboxylate isomerase [Nevskia sp.]